MFDAAGSAAHFTLSRAKLRGPADSRIHPHDKQTDSLSVQRAGRRSAGRERGGSSPAGTLHSGPSWRSQLWEPWTWLDGRAGSSIRTWNRRVSSKTQERRLTSPLMKYLRVKSVLDSRNLLFRNCLLSLPFFHSVTSSWSGFENNARKR